MRFRMWWLCLACAVSTTVRAQVIETPVAFDAAGRISVLTPELVSRLALPPEVLRIDGEWRDARLYATSDSTWVLAITRPSGAIERRTLTRDDHARLEGAIAAVSAQRGMPLQRAGTQELEGEDARGAFIRRQVALGAAAYGPSLAIAADNPDLWFLGLGTSFLTATLLAANERVTAPMSDASLDWGVRGLVLGGTLSAAFNTDRATFGSLLFAGSLGGAIAGFQVAREWTSAEADAAGWGSTTLALATAGITGTINNTSNDTWRSVRATNLLIATGLVAGLPLGLRYVREAPYAITAGDFDAMRVPQALGAALGASLVNLGEPAPAGLWAGATAGYLAGVVFGDRMLAKPYDYTRTQAGVLALGAGVGWLVVTPLADGMSERTVPLLFTGSAILGAALATWALPPVRATPGGLGDASAPRAGRGVREGVSVRIDPAAALLAWQRTPGRHAIVSLSF